jgi:SAM-dependent methyltransferase
VTASTDDAQARRRAIAGLFGRGAADYDQVGEFFTPMARDLVAAARVAVGERVLDLGCGRGAALFAAADAVGPGGHVTGIDLAERMVALTAEDARGLPHVSVALGDAEQPDFPAGAFDVVLGALVVFFLTDPVAALRRYATLLAPGGRLGFTTFARNDPNFEAAMRSVAAFVPGGVPKRGTRQGPFGSADGIAELLAAAGYAAPDISERTYETRFRDAEEWLSWTWSHGGRATLERVPADRLDDATAAATEAFQDARTAAGDYAIHTTIRITVARPGA